MWSVDHLGANRAACAAMALLAAGLVGCSVPASESAQPEVSSETSATASEDAQAAEASSICSEHFADMRHSQFASVGTVRNPGPALVSPPPGPLDPYPDDEPIVLCLVPNRELFDVVAVVLADDTTFVRWTQNLDDDFYWPI